MLTKNWFEIEIVHKIKMNIKEKYVFLQLLNILYQIVVSHVSLTYLTYYVLIYQTICQAFQLFQLCYKDALLPPPLNCSFLGVAAPVVGTIYAANVSSDWHRVKVGRHSWYNVPLTQLDFT